jgi:A/G-specific adenine glycosylase
MTYIVNEDGLEIPESRFFALPVIQWYKANKRDLPWRDSRNPYLIWISEVMLQQTRVDQMLPYYQRFISRFPDVDLLAGAEIHDVLIAWEGLGYYSRARNLHQAAKSIVNTHDSQIPDNWAQFRELKGVGDYTAAAVLSIAFNKPYAVVDGNVIRLITRYLGVSDDVRSLSTRRYIQRVVSKWIPSESPSDFNQGMMEIGSQICKPKNPLCAECPLSQRCVAFKTAQTNVIPFKSRAKKVPHHTIVVGIVGRSDGKVLISRRPESVMLGGLWEFPGGKVESGESLEHALNRELAEELGIILRNITPFHELKHAYSHFKITMHAYRCEIATGNPQPRSSDALEWVHVHELENYPFPKANRSLTQKLIEQKTDVRPNR